MGDNNGGTDPNDAVANAGAQILVADINDMRQRLQSINVNVPVGTSDAGAYFNNEVLAAIDFGVCVQCRAREWLMLMLLLGQLANVHPWFADVAIDQAAGWTWEFFQQTDVAAAAAVPNDPKMYVGETGWATVRHWFVFMIVRVFDVSIGLGKWF